MKDWPCLSVASLKAIERAEQEANSTLGSNIRPYTPADPKFRRTTDNLREGGHRAIDYICAYAETLFDAYAGEYAKRAVEITVSREVLTQRVAAEVERKASKAWDTWLFLASIVGPPKVGTAATLPGDIRIDAPPEHVKSGFKNHVFRRAEKPSDPKLGPIMLELEDRLRTQLQGLIEVRIHDWECLWATSKTPAKEPASQAVTKALSSRAARRASKGDITLLQKRDGNFYEAVDLPKAEQYAGISPRRRQQLVKEAVLKVTGLGQNRRITVESLLRYCPAQEHAK
jgi:hypothetical protein